MQRAMLLVVYAMKPSDPAPKTYRFAPWQLDLARGSLIGPGGEFTLRPKTLEVLQHLVVNAGRLVSRDDLLDTVWRDVTVTEESLTQCISEIRQTLGDSDQRFVKTVPRRGYLFAAPVETGQPASAASARIVRPTVVVLPFANLSGDPAQDFLADSLTEDIIAALSQFNEFAIIARQSTLALKGKSGDVRDVSKALDARYVIEGSIRRMGSQIRASARLIEGDLGSQRWSDRIDRTLGEFGEVMDDIIRSIVRPVVAQIGIAEEERALQSPNSSESSYENALRGDAEMRAFLRTWDVNRLYAARRCYETALKIEPGNAKICAELGNSYVRAYHEPLDGDYTNASVLQRGHDLAVQAVALDPFHPLARAHLGWALMWMRRHDASIAEFEKAIELNPNFTDFRFAAALIYSGNATRALQVLDHGIRAERMNNAHTYSIRGHALYLLGRYSEAELSLMENIKHMPKVPVGRVWLIAVLASLDRREEARRAASDLLQIAPSFTLESWPAFNLYRDQADRERILKLLRESGLQ